MVSKEEVKEALKNVTDPEIGMNIVDLGLLYFIEIEDGNVKIEMTMTSPMCPATQEIMDNAKNFVEKLDKVKKVEIQLIWDPPWDPDKMTEEGKAQLDFM